MSCSRFCAGSSWWMFSPRSSSAIARSLCRILMPLTLASAGSSDVATGSVAPLPVEDEFFEQAPAGSTSNASAASVANLKPCGASVPGLPGETNFSVVMARSLTNAGTAGDEGRTVAQSLPLCNGPIYVRFCRERGQEWPIDKDVTPSYVSENRLVQPQAAVCTNEGRKKPLMRQALALR